MRQLRLLLAGGHRQPLYGGHAALEQSSAIVGMTQILGLEVAHALHVTSIVGH